MVDKDKLLKVLIDYSFNEDAQTSLNRDFPFFINYGKDVWFGAVMSSSDEDEIYNEVLEDPLLAATVDFCYSYLQN